MTQDTIKKLLKSHALGAEFIDTVDRWYQPVARMVCRRLMQNKSKPMLLGVQGTQGSGKSTLSSFVAALLVHDYGLHVAVLSIDDFYLTRAERTALANTVHPLLQTRGVPGTHDLPLLHRTLSQLNTLKAGETMRIPRFNKAQDDRFAENQWDSLTGPVDLIIFEGWCIGAPAQTPDDLAEPQNALEKTHDGDARWRGYVNDQLAGPYADIFTQLDCLVVLQAPSFDCVYAWRLLQEQKLAERLAKERPNTPNKVLSEDDVRHFISHYERITRQCLRHLPQRADCVLTLNEQHEITSLTEHASGVTTLPLLVSTDLDGTLLDHHTYDWQPALPAISALQAFAVPIVMNTSKTAAEVQTLQQTLGLDFAFIVENGSAVYLPKRDYPEQLAGTVSAGDYWVKDFGIQRNDVVSYLHTLRKQHAFNFEGYSDWSVADVINHTQLTESNAARSMQRGYSEPIVWHDSEEKLAQLVTLLADKHMRIIKGGRFYHILGENDKGTSVLWLKQQLSQQNDVGYQLVALGDGPNDVDMLNVADYPVAIKSPSHDYPVFKQTRRSILTQTAGPSGWHTAIMSIIKAELSRTILGAP